MTRRLATPEVYQNFHKLFNELKRVHYRHLDLAKDLTSEIAKANWSQHHDYVYNTVSEEIDKTLFLLAKDFGLIGSQARYLVDTQNTPSASTEEKREELASLSPSQYQIGEK